MVSSATLKCSMILAKIRVVFVTRGALLVVEDGGRDNNYANKPFCSELLEKILKISIRNATSGYFFSNLLLDGKFRVCQMISIKMSSEMFKQESKTILLKALTSSIALCTGKGSSSQEDVKKENVTIGKFFTKLTSTLVKKGWSTKNLRIVPE